jgi:hypothetical protein
MQQELKNIRMAKKVQFIQPERVGEECYEGILRHCTVQVMFTRNAETALRQDQVIDQRKESIYACSIYQPHAMPNGLYSLHKDMLSLLAWYFSVHRQTNAHHLTNQSIAYLLVTHCCI